MKHHIAVSFTGFRNLILAAKLRKYISAALEAQQVPVACEINVLVTDDPTIQALNQANRQIDKSTDVLSFPMFDLIAGELPESWEEYMDPDTGRVPLGDMAISMDHAKAQAKEYGHSVNREVGYLTVHSILHLLGYDHVDEGPMKQQMREREEVILSSLGLKRTV